MRTIFKVMGKPVFEIERIYPPTPERSSDPGDCTTYAMRAGFVQDDMPMDHRRGY